MDQIKISNRLGNGIILGLLVSVLFAILMSFSSAIGWIQRPFTGVFYEPTFLVSPFPVFQNGLREVQNLDFYQPTQLIAINQQKIINENSFTQIIYGLKLNNEVQLSFKSSNSNLQNVVYIASNLSLIDQVAYFYFPFFLGVVFFIMAALNYWRQRRVNGKQTFSVFTGSIAIVLCASFDLLSSHRLYPLWIAALAFSGAGLFHLAIQHRNSFFLSKYIAGLVYFLAAIIVFITWITPYSIENPIYFIDYSRWIILFTGIFYLISFIIFIINMVRSIIPAEKMREFIRLSAGFISFAPISFWLISNAAGSDLLYSPWYLLSLILFPILIGISIQDRRLMQSSHVVSRTVQYGLLAVFVILGYAFLVTGVGLILQIKTQFVSPLIIGTLIFIFAILLNPVREWLKRKLDLFFFQGERGFQERLNSFSGDLKELLRIEDIVNLLRGDIYDSLTPTHFHLFLYDSTSESYQPSAQLQQRTSDLEFTNNSALVNLLNQENVPQYFPGFQQIPDSLSSEINKLKLLDAQLYVPIRGRKRLLGFLALSRKTSMDPYSSQEIEYVEALADQASLALDRLEVIGNLERRVLELNVLTRVAQGVNYTINLDDIYELFYTQTSQILPLDDVYLILRDINRNSLIQVFRIENNDRKYSKENKLIPSEESLEKLVLNSRQALRIVDYKKACSDHNYDAKWKDINAALFVPLNSGAETIGVAIVASRSPNIVYSREHLQILQAIADQVSGAIEKAKLLQETEERARQLSSLNDLTRQLTSTLALDPLLENILDSSVQILNCEAGFLLMADEESRELVFKVTSGLTLDGLINRRIPYGSGEASIAVRNRKPLILNQLDEEPEWVSILTHPEEFIARSVLVIPLFVKNDLLGVVEVFNKKDGMPFFNSDQEILSAFASQAAIALENANLYTRTDQALSDRVEELSIMQRVDRELNSNLDLLNAMTITLNWAMRQSDAVAGLIGFVVPDGIHIFKSEGYSQEDLGLYKDSMIPISEFGLLDVVQTGLPVQNWIIDDQTGLHPKATSQVVIPIRRETQTMAIIFLELSEEKKLNESQLGFLNRLSDHASIALVNGQLYAEVQSANDAKSEFVSFVSHELKNPMTSIKGYTELLAGGAVGEINEAQENFLQTIRSNIDRMNTLVSDLTDLSKIEAGRMRLEFTEVSLKEVIDEVLRSTNAQIQEKNQKLEIDIPEDLPLVWSDSTRLAQIFVNLISNAHKYTENGGIIEVTAEAVENVWDTGGARDVVHFLVKDSGIGINAEDQKKVFEKFFRSDDPKTREVPGTGLGLKITRSLVEMQGGKIWFNSEFRSGTTFHVTIPVATTGT